MTDHFITHEEVTKIIKDMLSSFGVVETTETNTLLKYIAQQEQRDKNVARYFELDNIHIDKITKKQDKEWFELRYKLPKVGKEE